MEVLRSRITGITPRNATEYLTGSREFTRYRSMLLDHVAGPWRRHRAIFMISMHLSRPLHGRFPFVNLYDLDIANLPP